MGRCFERPWPETGRSVSRLSPATRSPGAALVQGNGPRLRLPLTRGGGSSMAEPRAGTSETSVRVRSATLCLLSIAYWLPVGVVLPSDRSHTFPPEGPIQKGVSSDANTRIVLQIPIKGPREARTSGGVTRRGLDSLGGSHGTTALGRFRSRHDPRLPRSGRAGRGA